MGRGMGEEVGGEPSASRHRLLLLPRIKSNTESDERRLWVYLPNPPQPSSSPIYLTKYAPNFSTVLLFGIATSCLVLGC